MCVESLRFLQLCPQGGPGHRVSARQLALLWENLLSFWWERTSGRSPGKSEGDPEKERAKKGSPYSIQRLNLGLWLDPEAHAHEADEEQVNWDLGSVIHRCDRVHSLGLTK